MIRFREARRIAGRIGAGRFAAVFVLFILALLAARLSTRVPLFADAERALYDVRVLVAAPQVAQDDRIVMVVFNDETLIRTGRRSPLDRGLLGRALANIDRMGAKAIGIDILIDQQTPEDAQAIAALKAMRTPTFLAFATAASNAEQMLPMQEKFQRRFQADIRGGNAHPASIRLQTDPDNVIRSWPVRPKDTPPLLSNAMEPAARDFADYHRSIAFRLPKEADRPVFTSLPIDLFEDAATAEAMREVIGGRYVLIGGEILDTDRFDTPATRLTGVQTTGLEMHATMLAQQLDRHRPLRIRSMLLWLAAVVVVLAGASTAIREVGGWRLGVLLIVELGALAGVPFGLQMLDIDTQGLPAFGWMIGWVMAYSAAAAAARGVGSEQRRFAQSTLGRYLPREVATQILREPEQLTLKGERRTIYALFSDLEGFTKLTHAVDPETIAALLNRYLDELSGVVLAHGGTLDKFVGDAVVAFWGAPIAHADDAQRAYAAANELVEAGERFRRNLPPGMPPVGRTRVGLHRGDAVVGNFGGEGRIQYTALGDAMNTAARLESANKPLHTRALVSETVLNGIDPSALRPMGRIAVRGRSTPIAVFEPVDRETHSEISSLSALLDRFDEGDAAALPELEQLAANHPDDAALENLVYRLKRVGPGGYYVLE